MARDPQFGECSFISIRVMICWLTFRSLKADEFAVLALSCTVERLHAGIVHGIEMQSVDGAYRFLAAVNFLKRQSAKIVTLLGRKSAGDSLFALSSNPRALVRDFLFPRIPDRHVPIIIRHKWNRGESIENVPAQPSPRQFKLNYTSHGRSYFLPVTGSDKCIRGSPADPLSTLPANNATKSFLLSLIIYLNFEIGFFLSKSLFNQVGESEGNAEIWKSSGLLVI